jgi:hypothetical protein
MCGPLFRNNDYMVWNTGTGVDKALSHLSYCPWYTSPCKEFRSLQRLYIITVTATESSCYNNHYIFLPLNFVTTLILISFALRLLHSTIYPTRQFSERRIEHLFLAIHCLLALYERLLQQSYSLYWMKDQMVNAQASITWCPFFSIFF